MVHDEIGYRVAAATPKSGSQYVFASTERYSTDAGTLAESAINGQYGVEVFTEMKRKNKTSIASCTKTRHGCDAHTTVFGRRSEYDTGVMEKSRQL